IVHQQRRIESLEEYIVFKFFKTFLKYFNGFLLAVSSVKCNRIVRSILCALRIRFHLSLPESRYFILPVRSFENGLKQTDAGLVCTFYFNRLAKVQFRVDWHVVIQLSQSDAAVTRSLLKLPLFESCGFLWLQTIVNSKRF